VFRGSSNYIHQNKTAVCQSLARIKAFKFENLSLFKKRVREYDEADGNSIEGILIGETL